MGTAAPLPDAEVEDGDPVAELSAPPRLVGESVGDTKVDPPVELELALMVPTDAELEGAGVEDAVVTGTAEVVTG